MVIDFKDKHVELQYIIDGHGRDFVLQLVYVQSRKILEQNCPYTLC